MTTSYHIQGRQILDTTDSAEVLAIFDAQQVEHAETGFAVYLRYASKAEAEAALAAFGLPKYVKARAHAVSGWNPEAQAITHTGGIAIDIPGAANGTTGAANETGRKRLAKFLEVTSRAL